MKDGKPFGRSALGHPTRVGAVVALIMALVYVAAAVPFDIVYSQHLVGQVDARLADRLQDVKSEVMPTGTSSPGRDRTLPSVPEGQVPPDHDVDDAPAFVWIVAPDGTSRALTTGAPALAPASRARSGRPFTAALDGGAFRLEATSLGEGYLLVAGESLAQDSHLEAVVQRVEVVLGPLFVLAMFVGSVAIGALAARPVEQARRRQLEFTADASHELRTPLTVLEAEVSLALSARRDASSYRTALERVGTEGKRLRHIVEDLLFLARFDSTPPAPEDEPVDLATLAEACAERFQAVAGAQGTSLWVKTEGDRLALVNAPPAWVDRLCGVLVDNACRYAGPGGRVRLSVAAKGNMAVLAVDDTGPGIPQAERAFLFDRFHRATDKGEGAGLGLAIADAVVRSTGGRWRVADSDLGGAHMEVAWRLHPVRRSAERDRSEV